MKNLTEKEISLISRIIEKKDLNEEDLTTWKEILRNLNDEDYDDMVDFMADSENEDYETTCKKMLLNLINRHSKDGSLIFHATMSPEEFVANGYSNKEGVDVLINPKGNKHPKGFFIAWKSNEGVAYTGAVSTKLTAPEEFTAPMLSIVSTPDKPEEMFVLMHNRVDAPTIKFEQKSIPNKEELIYHATMSPEQFKASYADEKGVGVFVNPNGNKHPKGYFMAWKDSDGVSHNGAISNKITSPEEFVDPVVSIVSTPDNPNELFVLMHNQAELQDNSVINFK